MEKAWKSHGIWLGHEKIMENDSDMEKMGKNYGKRNTLCVDDVKVNKMSLTAVHSVNQFFNCNPVKFGTMAESCTAEVCVELPCKTSLWLLSSISCQLQCSNCDSLKLYAIPLASRNHTATCSGEN